MSEDMLESDFLLRRLPLNNPDFTKPDGTFCSNAFKLNRNAEGLSVDLLRISDYEVSIIDPKKYFLVKVPVTLITELNLECIHDPTTENPAHCLIKGIMTKSVSKKLAAAAEIHLQTPPNK